MKELFLPKKTNLFMFVRPHNHNDNDKTQELKWGKASTCACIARLHAPLPPCPPLLLWGVVVWCLLITSNSIRGVWTNIKLTWLHVEAIRVQWKNKAYLIAIVANHLLPLWWCAIMCCWYGLEGRREVKKKEAQRRKDEGKKSSSF